MQTIVADLRYALRQLRRSPGFTATALLTLTLAIGATTAMVSVLRATLLNPTPYAGADRLLSIADTNLKGFQANGLVTVSRAADLASAPGPDGRPLFQSSAFFYFDQPTLTITGHAPIPTAAVAASGAFFRVLGTSPLLGRTLTPADDAHGAPETVVLSYGLWQRAFGGDPSVVGRNALLFGKSTTVIGVMPQHFDYPSGTELWKPAHLFAQDFQGYRGGGTRFVRVLARLSDGVSAAQARRGADLLAARLAKSYAATDADWGFHLTGMRAEILGTYRTGLLLLSSAVAILLVIATANIAGLQISRNVARQPEIAVRRALGISTPRLIQQLLTESVLVFLLGAVPGALLAGALLRLANAALPAALLSFATPRLDVTTLCVTAAVAFLAATVCALAPALRLRRTPAVGVAAARTIHGERKGFGRGFAVAQIALALVLLTLASGVLRNLYLLLTTPLGYEASQVLTFSVHQPFGTDPGKLYRFYSELEQRLRTLPGVESVGSIDAPPLTPFMFQSKADIYGQSLTPHHDRTSAEARTITPGYLPTMQIPLLAGRNFTEQDRSPGAPPVELVNRSFAAKYFPGGSAVGKRLVFGVGEDTRPRSATVTVEIVGIVADVRGTGGELTADTRPELYRPDSGGWPDMHFVVRTPLPAGALEPALRTTLASIDAGAALGLVDTLSGSVDRALAQPRLNGALLAALAGLALLLVLIGVYGVLAFSVAARTRELAVRLALGSSRGAIFRMLLTEAAAMLALGLTLGIAGALAATRLLAAAVSLGTSASAANTPGAALTLGFTSILLAVAVLAASLVPARRATAIDPMQALRSE